MIKISGIIEQAMGKFSCLRGFAPIKDLEKLSTPSQSIQRDLISSHRGEMIEFLESREGTFFPEVILSTNLANTEYPWDEERELIWGGDRDESAYDSYSNEITQIATAVSSRQEMKKCQVGALSLTISFAKATTIQDSITEKYSNSTFSKSSASKTLVGNLTIDENKLKNKFIRIDGNHRLSAAQDLEEQYNYYTPFCLILFTSAEDQKKFSTLFFHNIN